MAVKDSLKADNVSVSVNGFDDTVEISAWFNGERNNIVINDSDQIEVNHFVDDFDTYYDWNGTQSTNISDADTDYQKSSFTLLNLRLLMDKHSTIKRT